MAAPSQPPHARPRATPAPNGVVLPDLLASPEATPLARASATRPAAEQGRAPAPAPVLRHGHLLVTLLMVWAVTACGDAASDPSPTDAMTGGGAAEIPTGGDDAAENPDVVERGVWVESARYELTWDWGEAWEDEEVGWRVVLDDGVEVHVQRGYLVNYSVSLAPCDLAAAAPRPPAPWAVALLDVVLGTSVAHAGHGDEADPSTARASRVEDLARPGVVVLDELSFAGNLYCRVHYLVARSDTGTEAMPEEVDMENASLHLEGTWQRPGEEAVAFEIHASLAHGLLPELDEVVVGEVAAGTSVVVTVERRLDGLLKGVDFEAMGGDELARVVLSNLMGEAEVSVRPGG